MTENRYVCPYCRKKIEKENVLFWEKTKSQYTDNVRGNFLRRHGVKVPAGNKFDRVYYRVRYENLSPQAEGEEASAESRQALNVIREDANGWPTMIEDYPENALTPENLDRDQSENREDSFDDAFDSDGFSDETEGRKERNDRETRNIPKRACPNCHCELPQQFGMLETYHVAMFGGRAAGKTAYLVNLFQQLKTQLSINNLGSVELAAESEAFLRPMIEDYEREGTTRPTAADGGLLPILCVYKHKGAEAFVIFYDIAGEGTSDAAYMANHEGISSCDSLMLMIDPNMFTGGAYYMQWTANHLDGEARYSDSGDCCREPLDSFLNQAGELCREYSDKIRTVVCVVTKMDMLLESHAKNFSSGNIELITDVKEKHRDAVNLPVLKEVNDELNVFLGKQYRINLKEKIKEIFGPEVRVNLLGVSTSTLVKGEGNTIRFEPRSSAMDSKHRIIEPFLVILMYYGLIPARRPDGSIVYYKNDEPEGLEEPGHKSNDNDPPKPPKKKTGGFFSRLFGRNKA